MLAEEDQDGEREKRRRIEDYRRQDLAQESKEASSNGMQLNGTDYVEVNPAATARGGPLHPSLPSRPGFDIVPKPTKNMTADQRETAALRAGMDNIPAMQGTTIEAANNRKSVRMANMSAAEALKAELEGGDDVNGDESTTQEQPVVVEGTEDEETVELKIDGAREVLEKQGEDEGIDEEIVAPALQTDEDEGEAEVERPGDKPANGDAEMAEPKEQSQSSRKRKASDVEDDSDRSDVEAPPDEESNQAVSKKKLKVDANGLVIEGYEDDVRLWEPGYRERYYERKFGVQLSDTEYVSQ